MYPTPTPFWDTNPAATTMPGIDLDLSAYSDMAVNGYVNGYNYISQAPVWDALLWLIVLAVVFVSVWSLIQHWQSI